MSKGTSFENQERKFKNIIKELRVKAGMTQSQLAAVLGKSEGAIRAWEIDKSKPDVDTLIKLVEYFNCTTDYLLGLNNYKTGEETNHIISLNNNSNDVILQLPEDKHLADFIIEEPDTIIGEGTEIEVVSLTGTDTICIHGHFTGNIETSRDILIGAKGTVIGNIKARCMLITGTVNGIIDCDDTLYLTSTSNVYGNSFAKSIIIDKGSRLKGEYEVTSSDKPFIHYPVNDINCR